MIAAARTGQLVVILGPSGCGKTTLLKMVNRLYEPTAGKIYLDGTDSADESHGTAPAGGCQQSGLFPHMTVAQNIAVVRSCWAGREQKIQPALMNC